MNHADPLAFGLIMGALAVIGFSAAVLLITTLFQIFVWRRRQRIFLSSATFALCCTTMVVGLVIGLYL